MQKSLPIRETVRSSLFCILYFVCCLFFAFFIVLMYFVIREFVHNPILSYTSSPFLFIRYPLYFFCSQFIVSIIISGNSPQIRNKVLWVAVTSTVRGKVFRANISTDPVVMKNPKHHIKPGTIHKAYVTRVDMKHQLIELTLTGRSLYGKYSNIVMHIHAHIASTD